jgi:hypothetical protein
MEEGVLIAQIRYGGEVTVSGAEAEAVDAQIRLGELGTEGLEEGNIMGLAAA